MVVWILFNPYNLYNPYNYNPYNYNPYKLCNQSNLIYIQNKLRLVLSLNNNFTNVSYLRIN